MALSPRRPQPRLVEFSFGYFSANPHFVPLLAVTGATSMGYQ